MQALIPVCLSIRTKAGIMQDKALIIVAHGSRKPSSNEEVKALGEQLRTLKQDAYSIIMTSFLEFADPTLEESILSCIDQGIDEIVILPYFLASGHHVTNDIPDIIESLQGKHPTLKVTLKPHLGSSPAMIQLLSTMAE